MFKMQSSDKSSFLQVWSRQVPSIRMSCGKGFPATWLYSVMFPTKHLPQALVFPLQELLQMVSPPQFTLPPKGALQTPSLREEIWSLLYEKKQLEIFHSWRIWITDREMDPCFCIALFFLCFVLCSKPDAMGDGSHTATWGLKHQHVTTSLKQAPNQRKTCLAVGWTVFEGVSSSISSPPQSWDFSRNQKSLLLLGTR